MKYNFWFKKCFNLTCRNQKVGQQYNYNVTFVSMHAEKLIKHVKCALKW